jgi:HlyD family secretion protein
MLKNKKILIPIALVFILIVAGVWYALSAASSSTNGELTASGTVEAVEVLISSEMAGRVSEVLADKGQLVKAGDPLIRLDDAILQTQHQQASAALDAAIANLSFASTGMEMAQAVLDAAEINAEAADAQARVELLSAQSALDELNQSAAVAKGQALAAVAVANRAVYDAQYLLDNLIIPNNQADMETMHAIEVMKQRLDDAVAAFEPYKFESSTDRVREDLKDDLEEARSDYNAAVRRLEYESGVARAQAVLDKATLDLSKVQDGPDPDQVAILEARITAAQIVPRQSQALIAQARLGLSEAQSRLVQAQAAVAQAQAQLDMLDEQINKLVIYAPISGILLSRDVQPGEVIQPGIAIMSIGQLDQLTITVYVPEDRYGQIKLGMPARVSVDSFPGQRFAAEVIHIADQAEFTPRNVQTVEGRSTTVFAVELSVTDPDGKLKPGMPADVVFGK